MPRYPWKRFWCPRDGAFSLADDGFLYDPDSEYGELANPAVRSFDKISARPCLVLLGGPGSGKTFALREEAEARTKAGALVHRIDLREYGEEASLRSAFAGQPFQDWEAGSSRLELFLDSLDECRAHIRALIAILEKQLRLQAARSDRLSLRIACRTAEWPETLTAVLKDIWGENGVGIYELARLRKKDVAAAASVRGLDGDRFVREVVGRGVQGLAITPVTFELLVNIFKKRGELPDRLVDLYEQGLRLLCEETPQRVDAGLAPEFSARQRLAIATRLAGVLVLGNRAAVYAGPDRGDVPEQDVLLETAVGGDEHDGTDPVHVTDDAVKDVLATELFSSRGAFRFGFAHQTFAEFLAARYLATHDFDLARIYSLVAVPDEPGLQIAPQLHETVAWLASLKEEIFSDLLEHQPEILLRSDVATGDLSSRSRLVENLLQRIRARAFAEWRELYSLFGKLDHPGLPAQLGPVIRDRNELQEVRCAAIDIAERCRRTDLVELLADIALDEGEDMRIRGEAAHAVVRMREPTSSRRLRRLALGEGGDDPDDELRGCGLQATWPKHLTAAELFACLTYPKNAHLFGAYKSFLMRRKFLDKLALADLPTALDWLLARDFGQDPLDPFREVANKIMCLAWRAVDALPVRERLARTVTKALKNHVDLDFWLGDRADPFKQLLVDDFERRRILLEAMVVAAADEKEMINFVCVQPPLATEEDFAWLVERARHDGNADAGKWAQLASFTFNPMNRIHVEEAWAARRSCEVLAATLSQTFPESVELGSPMAADMKRRYEEKRRFDARMQSMKPKPLDPPPVERVREVVDRCLKREPELWPNLCRELTLEPTSTRYPPEWGLDLTKLPGWKAATEETRQHIIRAAALFLDAHTPRPAEWIGTNTVNLADFSGLNAILLVERQTPSFVASISPDLWSGWGPVILGTPGFAGVDDETLEVLAAIAYQRAPGACIDALVRLVQVESDRHDHVFVVRRVARCWNGMLVSAMTEILRGISLKPRAMGTVLDAAIESGVTELEGLAADLIEIPPPKDGDPRLRSVEAARSLLSHAKDAGWTKIREAIAADADWGRAVLERACEVSLDSEFVGRFDDRQLGELLDWLYTHYPPSSDPKHEGGFVSPEQMVRNLRDRAIQVLVSRGTWSAVGELERLGREHPELPWLWRALLSARGARRRRTWTPVAPRELLEMARDAEKRFVESGLQLLDVLVESFDRLRVKLHGETPRVRFLWTEGPRPREENDLSDWIKGHLEDDLKARGIVVNREVEIRRRESDGGAAGQRTDIQVNAVRLVKGQPADIITVIMEVKGCWHPKLKTAMATQLVDRYLAENQCRHGLYVVGWFLCDAWSESGARKAQTPFASQDECVSFFSEQAAELSKTRLAPDGGIWAYVLDCALR